jgi:hypothetical protein
VPVIATVPAASLLVGGFSHAVRDPPRALEYPDEYPPWWVPSIFTVLSLDCKLCAIHLRGGGRGRFVGPPSRHRRLTRPPRRQHESAGRHATLPKVCLPLSIDASVT